jgi:hypothetical protein
VSAVPTDADTLTGFPQSDVWADRIDASGDLVSGDAWIFQAWPDAFFDQSIAVANAAGFDFDADLATGGLGDWALDYFEISTGLADLDGFHRGPSFHEDEE